MSIDAILAKSLRNYYELSPELQDALKVVYQSDKFFLHSIDFVRLNSIVLQAS